MVDEEKFPGCGGAFRMLDTYGLPLVMSMDRVEKEGWRVACDVFVYDAIVSGWSLKKAVAVVSEAWASKYGTRKAEELSERLERITKEEIANGILRQHKVSAVALL